MFHTGIALSHLKHPAATSPLSTADLPAPGAHLVTSRRPVTSLSPVVTACTGHHRRAAHGACVRHLMRLPAAAAAAMMTGGLR